MLMTRSRMTQNNLTMLSEKIARIQFEYLLTDDKITNFDEVSSVGTLAFDFGLTNEEHFKGTADAANISLQTNLEQVNQEFSR